MLRRICATRAVRGPRLRPRRSRTATAAGLSRSDPRLRQDARPDRRRSPSASSRGARRCSSRAPTREAFDAVAPSFPARRITTSARAITLQQGEIPQASAPCWSRAPARRICRSPKKRPSPPSSWATRSTGSTTSASPASIVCLREHDRLRRARVIDRRRRDGRRAAERGRRAWCSVPVIAVPTSVGYGASFGGHRGAARHAEQLRERRLGREHRQRLRRRLHGDVESIICDYANDRVPSPQLLPRIPTPK